MASVNGVAITEAEVDEMVVALMQRGQNVNNEQGRKMVLEQLISKKLLLLDAQKNPDKYADLLVRIGGYSDYFTKIPKRLQDDVIARSQN